MIVTIEIQFDETISDDIIDNIKKEVPEYTSMYDDCSCEIDSKHSGIDYRILNIISLKTGIPNNSIAWYFIDFDVDNQLVHIEYYDDPLNPFKNTTLCKDDYEEYNLIVYFNTPDEVNDFNKIHFDMFNKKVDEWDTYKLERVATKCIEALQNKELKHYVEDVEIVNEDIIRIQCDPLEFDAYRGTEERDCKHCKFDEMNAGAYPCCDCSWITTHKRHSKWKPKGD